MWCLACLCSTGCLLVCQQCWEDGAGRCSFLQPCWHPQCLQASPCLSGCLGGGHVGIVGTGSTPRRKKGPSTGLARPCAPEAGVSGASWGLSSHHPAGASAPSASRDQSSFQPLWLKGVLSPSFRVGLFESSPVALDLPHVSVKSGYVALVSRPSASWQGEQRAGKSLKSAA